VSCTEHQSCSSVPRNTYHGGNSDSDVSTLTAFVCRLQETVGNRRKNDNTERHRGKSKVMIFVVKSSDFPNFIFYDATFSRVSMCTFLGYSITEDLSDNDDMQYKAIYVLIMPCFEILRLYIICK